MPTPASHPLGFRVWGLGFRVQGVFREINQIMGNQMEIKMKKVMESGFRCQ